ncbi:MAG: hypothetical protein RL757_2280 [Bacteroidota bacterium]|jgi:putative ABC transport system permease protein
MLPLKYIYEAANQAWGQLLGNRLRSTLSLLGVAIGIACIIAVKSAVNSLEDNIKESFNKLGDDVIYITKMPWGEDPDENYWKYQRRPNPSFADYNYLKERLHSAQLVSFYLVVVNKMIQYEGVGESALAVAATYEFGEFQNLEFEAGRYFSQAEYNGAAKKVVLGSALAEKLFGTLDPIGREVKYLGQKLQVVGIIKRAGKSILQPFPFDDMIIVGYEMARSVVNVKPTAFWSTSLTVKAQKGVSLPQLKDEIIGTLRSAHHLPPNEKNNFATNELSIITAATEQFFGILNLLGYIIGGFSLVVGMFSVANIMFVSVKERTSMIGIKKALGAQKGVILTEFLIESVILSIVGGIAGLIFVIGLLKVASIASDFPIYVSWANIITTFIISVIVGVVAGIIPANLAANLDPVEAMRT